MTASDVINEWFAGDRAVDKTGKVYTRGETLMAYGHPAARIESRGTVIINGDWLGFSGQWVKKLVRRHLPKGCCVIVESFKEIDAIRKQKEENP